VDWIVKYYLEEFRLEAQTVITYHPNVFTLTLALSESRADTAWEPSNKMPPPPTRNKITHFSPQFSLCFCSSDILHISLFFGFKGLKEMAKHSAPSITVSISGSSTYLLRGKKG
jgi:hypothetical protein